MIHGPSAVVIEVRAIADDGSVRITVRESARHEPNVECHLQRLAPLQSVHQIDRTMTERIVGDDNAALPIERQAPGLDLRVEKEVNRADWGRSFVDQRIRAADVDDAPFGSGR
jgi:hypothetical protein